MLAGGDADLVAQMVEGGRAMPVPMKPLPAPSAATTQVAERVIPRPTMTGGMPTPTTPRINPSALGNVANANVVNEARSTALGDMLRGGARAVGRGAMAAGRFAKENVEPLAYGASAISESLAASRRTALEEEQLRLEQERRNRLAELLMPLFQAEVQQYGQSRRG